MTPDRMVSARNSALWAAYGDALGFITELSDSGGVRWRSGVSRIERTVPWKRKIDGPFGTTAEFPAGTYSDDTQLRLAVARSIDGGGHFDVEVFANIELSVWSAYALGAGRASKLAAANIARKDVNWFSNFYEGRSASYWQSGGNGAAMRIQPHVWAAKNLLDYKALAQDIFKDSICTHGHPRAFVGAILHGWWLASTILNGTPPEPNQWLSDIQELNELESWIDEDQMISSFWLPAWRNNSAVSFKQAIKVVCEEIQRDIEILNSSSLFELEFNSLVERIGGFEPTQVGSGTKTVILSAMAAWRNRKSGPKDAIIEIINTLGCDTDSIGTMTGAIMGAIATHSPDGDIQDKGYISSSAERLGRISMGEIVKGFTYPDPRHWSTPKTLGDFVTRTEAGYKVLGLGDASPINEPGRSRQDNGIGRQWLQLHFNQSIFVKLRPNQVPSKQVNQSFKQKPVISAVKISPIIESTNLPSTDLDDITQEAIRSNFDEKLIGSQVLSFASQPDAIEKAIAYIAIILKAKRSRWKKDQDQSQQ